MTLDQKEKRSDLSSLETARTLQIGSKNTDGGISQVGFEFCCYNSL